MADPGSAPTRPDPLLDDLDDVQNVFSNADFSDEALAGME